MNTLLMALAILGCNPPEPVLSGIPETPLLSEKEAPAKRTAEAQAQASYEKPGNVYVDIRYLCGQPFNAVRAELSDQLGTKQNERQLDALRGREIQYTRGRIRVADGIVYMVTIHLLEPMYRRVAFEKTGFPPFTGALIRLSNEYRINNEWDFRRIRLTRSGRDAEKVNEVQVWRWLPKERQ